MVQYCIILTLLVCGGFQFDVDDAVISGGSGGDSGAAGFVVSAGNSTVLGFSF